MKREVAWTICLPDSGWESRGAACSFMEQQAFALPLFPGLVSCWSLKSITMLPCSGGANRWEKSQKSAEEETGEGPGLLPTQITESLLTHFWVLTNPHLLTTYAQIVRTLTLEVGSRRGQSSGNPLQLFHVTNLSACTRLGHGHQIKAPNPCSVASGIVTKPQRRTPDP